MAKRLVTKRSLDPTAAATTTATHVTGTARTGGATTAGARGIGEKTSGDPSTDFERIYGTAADRGQAELERKLETERQLALQQAAGKLGFAQSSGPGTAGRWGAAETALNREFNLAKLQNLERAQLFRTGLEVDYLQRQDAYGQQRFMARMQFQQQQALMQQRAELNSASWWEQLGGILGFVAGLPVGAGLTVAGYALAQVR